MAEVILQFCTAVDIIIEMWKSNCRNLLSTRKYLATHNQTRHLHSSDLGFHSCKTITIKSFSCDTITSLRPVLIRRIRRSSFGSRSRATFVARVASLVRFCLCALELDDEERRQCGENNSSRRNTRRSILCVFIRNNPHTLAKSSATLLVISTWWRRTVPSLLQMTYPSTPSKSLIRTRASSISLWRHGMDWMMRWKECIEWLDEQIEQATWRQMTIEWESYHFEKRVERRGSNKRKGKSEYHSFLKFLLHTAKSKIIYRRPPHFGQQQRGSIARLPPKKYSHLPTSLLEHVLRLRLIHYLFCIAPLFA
jgi:hypothetical protein